MAADVLMRRHFMGQAAHGTVPALPDFFVLCPIHHAGRMAIVCHVPCVQQGGTLCLWHLMLSSWGLTLCHMGSDVFARGV